MFVEETLLTKNGPIRCAITDAKHVCISAPYKRTVNCEDLTPLEIKEKLYVHRGTPVDFILHLHLIDGVWRRKNGEYLYSDDLSFNGKDVVEAVCVAAFTEYTKTHPGQMKAAQVLHLERKVTNAEEAVEKAQEALNTANATLAEAQHELETLKNS